MGTDDQASGHLRQAVVVGFGRTRGVPDDPRPGGGVQLTVWNEIG